MAVAKPMIIHQNLIIGNVDDGTRSFDGKIDDVRIYNRALTPDEIRRLYNIGGGR